MSIYENFSKDELMSKIEALEADLSTSVWKNAKTEMMDDHLQDQ